MPSMSNERALSKVSFASLFGASRSLSAKSEVGTLVRMMPLAVLMPTNASLGLVLPSGKPEKTYQPFTNSVTVADIKDRVEIMQSLQKPKKASTNILKHSTQPYLGRII